MIYYYELIFSIKNTGYGKLKLDYAIYFIECIEKDENIIIIIFALNYIRRKPLYSLRTNFF